MKKLRAVFLLSLAVLLIACAAVQGASRYWSLLLNPASDSPGSYELGGQLNPFAIPEMRLLLNQAIDRIHVIGLYKGTETGDVMYTPLPHSECFACVKFAEDLGIDADGLDTVHFRQAVSDLMFDVGAVVTDGLWNYNGQVVELSFPIRTDTSDGRSDVAEYLRLLLETAGFTVNGKYGDKAAEKALVRNTDPRDGEWHLVLEGWMWSPGAKPQAFIAQHYYPGWKNMPGWGISSYWQYSNSDVEQPMYDVLYGTPSYGYQVSERLVMALEAGLEDSVRIFLGSFE